MGENSGHAVYLRLFSHSSFTFEVHVLKKLDTTLSAVRYRNTILFKIMSEVNEETTSLFLVAHYKSSIFFKDTKLYEISEFWIFHYQFHLLVILIYIGLCVHGDQSTGFHSLGFM